MPFASQKQRGLFYKAKNDPSFRKKKGLNLKAVDRMISHDKPGKLPMRAK